MVKSKFIRLIFTYHISPSSFPLSRIYSLPSLSLPRSSPCHPTSLLPSLLSFLSLLFPPLLLSFLLLPSSIHFIPRPTPFLKPSLKVVHPQYQWHVWSQEKKTCLSSKPMWNFRGKIKKRHACKNFKMTFFASKNKLFSEFRIYCVSLFSNQDHPFSRVKG